MLLSTEVVEDTLSMVTVWLFCASSTFIALSTLDFEGHYNVRGTITTRSWFRTLINVERRVIN